MITTALRSETGRNKYYPNKQHPNEIDPSDCPATYASFCKGDCLDPVYQDGTCLVFSRTEQVEPGDYVGIWLHPDLVPADELPRRIKKLHMAIAPGVTFPFTPRPSDGFEPIVVLEQLNPPRLYHLRASEILAMHKVIGKAQVDENGTARMPRLQKERLAA